jgi:signal transduction histidine kinase
MLNGYIITSSILAIIFVLLGLAVLFRNPRATTNKLFLIFSSTIAVWLVSNYIAGSVDYSNNVSLLANKLVLFFGGISTLALLIFSRVLVRKSIGRIWVIALVINSLIIVGCFSPWIVQNVSIQNGTYSIKFGWLSAPYFTALLINFLAIMATLLLSRAKSSGVQKAQINTVLMSLSVTLGAILTTNALLPFIFNYYGMTNFGSFFTLILVSGMAYSIAKHKLFDLRLVVARSLAYVLSVTVISALFVALVFGISNLIFHLRIPANQEIYLGILSAIIALTFQSIKSAFDKLSNKLFFRNLYDLQDFLNELSDITANTIDLATIQSNSLKLIKRDLKVQKSNFILIRPNGDVYEDLSDTNTQKDTFSELRNLQVSSSKIMLYSDDKIEPHSKKILAKIGAEAVVPLDVNKTRVGYIILGLKSSGQSFTDQDLSVLGIGADSLAVSVQNALRFEEISQFNLTLQEKVDSATRQLRKANERLKALDETKDDFISMASHQLRTPLTSIKGYISMVLEGDAGELNKTQHEMIGQAFFSSQRMVYLIADLLNVSRLKTGKFIIERVKINLADIIEQEISQLKETAAARQLALNFDKPKDFPDLMLDETKTRQVIMNFIDNAIYYTPASGHIDVKLLDNPNNIELRVEDDGIGVSKTDQPHLFTKFYRASNARKARPDGTGLGLFMAKKVIIAQEGSLIFESTEGKGSTFGFMFSKSKVGVDSSKSYKVESS